jgi:ethylene receptor
MTLVLRFQLQPSLASSNLLGESFDREHYSLPSNQIAGLKVLLIDDDEINLVVARKLLERLGCTVSSGSGLMDSSSASFQLVMVNLEMSAMDPLDAASRIRQQYRSSHWPLVMAMTSEQNVWEKCAQSGINGVLKKPLVLLEVKEELERILQNT